MGNSRRSDGLDLLGSISRLERAHDVRKLRRQVVRLMSTIGSSTDDKIRLRTNGRARSMSSVSRQFLLGELQQIEKTKTAERARYYASRLMKALGEVNTGEFNDINLNRWKEYDNILTDSMWVLQKRDASGLHSAWYWGNFIPQIPHQLMLRYTKKGDWVLDPFAGSGTTLLECQRLGRNCLGVELQPSVAKKASAMLEKAPSHRARLTIALEIGDSTKVNIRELLKKHGSKSVQLAILHPPYHNIIRFSGNRRDLSNAKSPKEFAERFGAVVDRVTSVLDDGRFLAVVIGDKYEKGEWVPLGFLVMNEVLKRTYKLKSIVVKNFDETLGKRSQKELWRYRALAGGFYVFKHEYIFIFQKNA